MGSGGIIAIDLPYSDVSSWITSAMIVSDQWLPHNALFSVRNVRFEYRQLFVTVSCVCSGDTEPFPRWLCN